VKPLRIVFSYQGGLSVTARNHPLFLLSKELAAVGAEIFILISPQPDRKSPVWEDVSLNKNITVREIPRWIEKIGKLWHPAAKALHIARHAFKERISWSESRAYLACDDHFYASYRLWKREMDKICKEFHPDAIVSFTASGSSAALVDWAKARDLPYWYAENSCGPGADGIPTRAYRKWKPLWKKLDGIIGHTQSLETLYRNHGFAGTYYYLPHWTSFTYERATPVWRENASKPFVIASLGRMDPFKGYDTLCDAVFLCRKRGLDVRVRLVGDAEPASEFQKQFEGKDWIELRPPFFREKDLIDFFQGVDLFVMASLFEGPCLALLEAMALGLPCAVSEVGGMPEILQGQGRLFPPADPVALSNLISELAMNRAALKAMSTGSLRRFEELTNLGTIRGKVEGLAKSLQGK